MSALQKKLSVTEVKKSLLLQSGNITFPHGALFNQALHYYQLITMPGNINAVFLLTLLESQQALYS